MSRVAATCALTPRLRRGCGALPPPARGAPPRTPQPSPNPNPSPDPSPDPDPDPDPNPDPDPDPKPNPNPNPNPKLNLLRALADADASAGLQADSLTFYALSHAAASGSASGRRTLQPALFLEAVDLADEMAGL